jgi:hypothetical protein
MASQVCSDNRKADSPLPAVTFAIHTWNDAPYPATRLISSSDAGFSKADVSPSFSPVHGAHDPAHHFCIPRLRYVSNENYFARSERFAKLGGERVF